MVQYEESLLSGDAPVYDTSGTWYSYFFGTRASIDCKDRPLVWAMKMHSTDFSWAEALKGDKVAQRKIADQIDNAAVNTTVDGKVEESSSNYSCKCGPSPEMKAEMLNFLRMLSRNELQQLEQSRTEFRAKMKAKWAEKKAQCQQRRSSSSWCRMMSGGCSQGGCSSNGSEAKSFDGDMPTSTEYNKTSTPLEGTV